MNPQEQAALTPGMPIIVQGYVDDDSQTTRLNKPELTAVESAGQEGIYAPVQGEIRRIPAHLVELARFERRPIWHADVTLERVRLFYAASRNDVLRLS